MNEKIYDCFKNVRHEAHATRVVLESRIVEALFGPSAQGGFAHRGRSVSYWGIRRALWRDAGRRVPSPGTPPHALAMRVLRGGSNSRTGSLAGESWVRGSPRESKAFPKKHRMRSDFQCQGIARPSSSLRRRAGWLVKRPSTPRSSIRCICASGSTVKT